MSRAASRVLTVLVALACLVPASMAVGVASAADGSRTLSFGATPQARSGQTRTQATQALEAQIGRTLQTVRVFESWVSSFPDSFHLFLRDGGRIPILSVKTNRGGAPVRWSSIASAEPGSSLYDEIVGWGTRLRDYGAPIYVALNHEPEASASSSYGSAADFVAAWRHWVEIIRGVGATNVRFMWIMTANAFAVPSSDSRQAVKWYPGDAWVDAIGADAYNWASCRSGVSTPWRSLADIVEGLRVFGLAHPAVPLWLAEWGSTEDAAVPGRKAAWIDDARALFAQPAYAQFVGVSYFNAAASQPACNWWADSSAGALASFTAMGADPLYQGDGWPGGQVTPTDTPPTAVLTTSCTDATCSVDGSGSHDEEGAIASWSWSFGDGATASGATATHAYAASGTYPVTLTVTDEAGATGTASTSVTVTVPATPSTVRFVGAASKDANATAHTVAVPSSVAAGDGLLLAITINTTATIADPTGVTGWTSLGTVRSGSLTSQLWRKVATASDAGRSVRVALSSGSKADLLVAAYRGTSATDPVALVASVAATGSSATRTAPTVAVPAPGAWVVGYWAHKDAATTALVAPAGVSVRATGTQTGSGRVTALLADTGGPVGPGAFSPGAVQAAAASSYGAAWTLVLAPA